MIAAAAVRRAAALAPLRRESRGVATLILLRHGQSVWNSPTATFTGWVDVDLTDIGRQEARAAGELLAERGYRSIDSAFTSELRRAYETCELVQDALETAAQVARPRAARDIRLNERHYGVVQGLCKGDINLTRYGLENVREWRRSMHAAPPPLDELHPHWQPAPAPRTESLADCQRRALECFEQAIAPALFAADGLKILLVAHSNTLRSLMAAFDSVPDADVPRLHVPNSVPIIYRFCSHTRKPISTKLDSSAGKSHARWLLSEENNSRLRKALQPGGTLTRAVFEAWDCNGDGILTHAEITRGLRQLTKSHDMDEAAVANIARRIVYEVTSGPGNCTLEAFEKRAARACADIIPHIGILH